MSASMDSEQRKIHIRNTFDTVCAGYDSPALRFFNNAAALLPGKFNLRGNETLLDVASGTGTPALALAPHVPRGGVTAVDFSTGMLSRGRAKARQRNINNIQFLAMDMTAMAVPDQWFDGANCSFGVFFTEDMVATVKHIASKIKPGGKLVTCHFHEGSMSPLNDLFLERVQAYGVTVPPISWKRVCTEQANRDLYTAAGLTQVTTQRHDVGYRFNDATQWWDCVWWAGYRGLIAGLDAVTLERFKAEHLAEVATTADADGIPMNVQVVITVGTVPG